MGLVYSQPACQSAYAGDLSSLQRLLTSDPRCVNGAEPGGGDTPLIAACRRGNATTVRYLLGAGADVHLTNKKQRTCLHYSSRWSLSVLDYLMISILMPVLLLGYFLLLQKQRQSVRVMDVLLRSDININAVDYKGNTALHYVCERRSLHLLPLLLHRNADSSIRNKDSETPLDIATRLRFGQIIYMLKTQ